MDACKPMTRMTAKPALIAISLLMAIRASLPGSALAAPSDRPATGGPQADPRNAMHEHWRNMSPAEREEIRTKMQQRWSTMPPDVRKEKRDAMRQHWRNMSPAEHNQFRRVLDNQSGK